MGPILMGTHVASVSRHVLPYVDIPHCDMCGKDPLHSKRSIYEVGRCPCSNKRIGAVSIVNGNVCGCFHECWHERFIVFCDLVQVH
jgi:hypothetical protein